MSLRVAVLTRASPSGHCLVHALASRAPLVSVVYETPPPPTARERLARVGREVSRRGLLSALDRAAERALFGSWEGRELARLARSRLGARAAAPPPGCPVHRLPDLRAPQASALVRGLGAELLVVCGTSLLPEGVFAAAPLGAINVHFGIAPRYRGHGNAWALHARDYAHVGVTVHRIDAGIDTGEVLARRRVSFDPARDDPRSLEVRCWEAGAELALDVVLRIERGEAAPCEPSPRGPARSQLGLARRLALELRLARARRR